MTYFFTTQQLSNIWMDYVNFQSLRATASKFSLTTKYLMKLFRSNYGDDYVERSRQEKYPSGMELWLDYLKYESLSKVAIAHNLSISTVSTILSDFVGEDYVSKARHGVYKICKELLQNEIIDKKNRELLSIWIQQKIDLIAEVDASSTVKLYSNKELEHSHKELEYNEKDDYTRYFNY